MALPVNNGTTFFFFASSHSRRPDFTPPPLNNLPFFSSSSLLKHHRHHTCKYSPRLFSVSSAAGGLELQQQQQQLDGTLTHPGWQEFAENVSGEWDGFEAEFTQEGSPIELPESVVPGAYREWEVQVFDWQTQCPTLADPTHFAELNYKNIRLLPTVGCEADAATRYSLEERNLIKASAFAYSSNGCYVAVWNVAGDGGGLMELEHCLVNPRDKESRVRIIQVVGVDEKGGGGLELKRIKVFREQWYGPFRNGDQLGGCAIRDSAFATTKAMESLEISGVWKGLNAIATFKEEEEEEKVISIRELVDESVVRKSDRDGSRLTLLPKQLWCCVDNDDEAKGETCCQVGWLFDQGLGITSRCFFSTGAQLKEIAIACENQE